MMKTHCSKGHEFTPDNIRWYGPDGSWRLCLKCKLDNDRQYRQKPGNAEKSRARSKRWRQENPERSKELALRHYDSIREIIEAAKDVPCADCGVEYPHYVMDFDHRDRSTKLMNVGESRSKTKTIAEIAKCDVVCANCHRERTWKGNGRGRKE